MNQGFVESKRARFIAQLTGTMAAGDVLALKHDLDFVNISEAVEADAEGRELAAVDPVAHHKIDATWNTCPGCDNYGIEVDVGIIEACQYDPGPGSRYLWHEHDAFTFLTPSAAGDKVNYQVPVPSGGQPQCNSPNDCQDPDGCSSNVTCIDKRCVTRHGSEVASVISASKGAPSGAAKVRLHVANGQRPFSASGHATSYDFLTSEGVRTVNESYYGGGLATADYFARVLEVLVVKGAGNDPGLPACPNTANSICVGATTAAGAMTWYSSYVNPNGVVGGTAFPDREEPDVVAFGGDATMQANPVPVDGVQIHGWGSTSDWGGEASGTSFSAPSVTSMVAHLRNACEPYFGFMEQEQIRAIFRTAAWVGNPEGPRYSTPNLISSYKDGGGFVDAFAVDEFCQPGPNTNSGIFTVDLERGDPMPPGDPSYPPPNGEEWELSMPMAYNAPNDPSFVRKVEVMHAFEFRAGNRIRYTISWDACALDPQMTSNAAVGADLDLFLYNATTQSYVFGSQSLDDNNEGFDFDIPEDGTYEVMLAWEENTNTDCFGSSLVDVGWAWKAGAW